MVVLAIGTIVAAIVVGGFRSVSEGNRKTSCQANLAQIYLASKQYAQDFDGRFPYFNGGEAANSTQIGFGLWNLYAFTPNDGTAQNCNESSKTNFAFPEPEANSGRLTGYARALKIFHCPSDQFTESAKYSIDNCATRPSPARTLTTGEPIFTPDGTTQRYINPLFMSYQVQDDVGAEQTYSVFREAYVPNDGDRSSFRQLQPFQGDATNTIVRRAPDATTVITWCRFHRSLSDRYTTRDKRNYDNVLFYDGSVQFLPTRMNATNGSSTNTGGLTGWNRLPRGAFR